MRIATIGEQYSPAQLCVGKEWVIKFYINHPETGKRERIRIKLNRIKDLKERLRYGNRRVKELNALLALGWNPLRDGDSTKVAKPLSEAMDDFIRAKVREKREKDTIRSYRSMCGLLLQWVRRSPLPKCTVGGFDESMAKRFMAESYVERELSPKTFNNNHSFYLSFWNWLIDQDYCGSNVFKSVKRKQVPKEWRTRRPPTQEERERIRLHLEESDPRFYAFCLMCFHMAIRPKEAFMLKAEQFHLERQSILIPGFISKNDLTQGVAIPDVLMPYLLKIGIEEMRADHYVFSTNFRPGPLLRDSRHSGKRWNRVQKAIKLDKAVTFYQLKHAGGIQLSRDGVSDVDLMNHFRHHDLAQTSQYTKQSLKEGVRTVITKATPF